MSTSGEHASCLSEEIDIDAPEAGPGVLLLPGRLFNFDYEGGEFCIAGVPVIIHEEPNTGLGTGLTVWDGSVVLSKYLEHANVPLWDGDTVELGAGAGVVGLAASVLGSPHVYLTDLEYTHDNLRRSVKSNAAHLRGAVSVATLDWFHPRDCAIDFSTVRFILGADVVWVDSLIPGLVAAIAHVAREAERHMQTTSNNAATAGDGDEVPSHSLATSKCVATNAFPTILIAHQTRSRASDGLFFSLLEAAGLALTFIPREEQHPSYSDAAIRIIRITRASRDAPSRSTPPSKR